MFSFGRMAAVSGRSGPGFWQTHPSPEDRMEELEDVEGGQTPGYEARKARFEEALATAGSPAAYSASGSQSSSTFWIFGT